MIKDTRPATMPEVSQLEEELRRVEYHKTYRKVLKNIIYTLITVAAVAVLLTVFFLQVFRIYGQSMAPGLGDGDLVLVAKGADFQTGDVIAFYYNNKILVKRVIAQSGDLVDMDEAGNVYVNQQKLEEVYVSEKSAGSSETALPCQVPEGQWFVLGDNRSELSDSRNTAIGCISEEQIIGKLIFKIWPLGHIE